MSFIFWSFHSPLGHISCFSNHLAIDLLTLGFLGSMSGRVILDQPMKHACAFKFPSASSFYVT